MSISVFNPIHSSFPHINEKCKVLRNAGSIFNWGQKAYEIKPFINGPGLELIEIKGSKPSFIGIILRIAAYITVLIPLIMLIGALIYRAVNKFQISTNQDIFQENDIGKSIVSRLSREDLLTMRLTSQNNKWLAESILIDRLNSKEITPAYFGVSNVKDLITYFGNRCCEVSRLYLRDFHNNVSDSDMEMVGQSFPKARKLFLNHAQITNESINSILKLPLLEKLELSNCEQITDISSLQQLPRLKEIYLLHCKITDFTFLQNMQSLTGLGLDLPKHITNINYLENLEKLEKLGLSGDQNISDFRPLLKLKSLKSLHLLDCNHLNDLSVLQNLQGLKQLTIFEGKNISHFEPLQQLQSLKSLSLWSSHVRDLSFLQGLKLEELHFIQCNQIEDLKFLECLKELKVLDLTGCPKITDLRPLQQLEQLEFLNLSLCDLITDISCLEGLQGLKITRYSLN